MNGLFGESMPDIILPGSAGRIEARYQRQKNPGAPMAQPPGVVSRPVPNGRPNVSGQPQMPVTRPMPVPQIPTPPPHARPVIRRKVPPQQQQTQPAAQPQPEIDDDDSDLGDSN